MTLERNALTSYLALVSNKVPSKVILSSNSDYLYQVLVAQRICCHRHSIIVTFMCYICNSSLFFASLQTIELTISRQMTNKTWLGE